MAVPLTMLSLGIHGIRLGPSATAFFSPKFSDTSPPLTD